MDQGAFLKAARVASGMRQEDVAEKARINVRTVARAERGLPVKADTILDICAVLNIDPAAVPPAGAGEEPDPRAAPPERGGAAPDRPGLGARFGARTGILGIACLAALSAWLGLAGSVTALVALSPHDTLVGHLNDWSVEASGGAVQRVVDRTAAALDAAVPGTALRVRSVVREGLPQQVLDTGDPERDWMVHLMEPVWKGEDFAIGFDRWPLSWLRSQQVTPSPSYAVIGIGAVVPDLVVLDVGPVEPAVCVEVVDGLPLSMAGRLRYMVVPVNPRAPASPAAGFRRPEGPMFGGRSGCAERSLVRIAVARAGGPVDTLVAGVPDGQGGH